MKKKTNMKKSLTFSPVAAWRTSPQQTCCRLTLALASCLLHDGIFTRFPGVISWALDSLPW